MHVVYLLVSFDGGMPAKGRQHHLQSIHNDTHVLLVLPQQGKVVPRYVHNLEIIAQGCPTQAMGQRALAPIVKVGAGTPLPGPKVNHLATLHQPVLCQKSFAPAQRLSACTPQVSQCAIRD